MSIFSRVLVAFGAVFLLNSAIAADAPNPMAVPDPDCPGYPSARSAAQAAFAAVPDSQKAFAGVIFRKEGRYYFTLPVENKTDNEVAFRFSEDKKNVAGFYHTHPYDNPGAGYISRSEFMLAKSYGGAIYISSGKPGTPITECDPSGKCKLERQPRTGSRIGTLQLARGSIMPAKDPDEGLLAAASE